MLGISNSYRTALNRNKEMSNDFNKTAIAWKKAYETEYTNMIAAGLDPKNKEHLKNYRLEHGAPSSFQVCVFIFCINLINQSNNGKSS